MIQRIQSVFLLVAGIAGLLSFVLPFYAAKQADNTYLKVFASNNFVLMPLVVGAAVLALVTIFLYKNRKRQMQLSLLGAAFSVAGLVMIYLQTSKFTDVTYGLGFLLPFIMLVLFLMAWRSINKDEKLIKSLDRLR